MALKKIDNRKDILLLLLYSPGRSESFNEPITGRTRLVKMIYLFKEEALAQFKRGTEITDENFYKFFPWNFGPFSAEVYDDLTFFILRGFIESNDANEEALPESAEEWDKWSSESDAELENGEVQEYFEEEFKLTEKGMKFSKDLFDVLSDSQKKLIKEFKSRIINVPLRAILKYVYEKYPQMIEKSEIKEQILGS